jgi:transposase-like protein
MSERVEVGANGGSRKRLLRTPEEKRRIVEATLVPGASIVRVAREHGVNANQQRAIQKISQLAQTAPKALIEP